MTITFASEDFDLIATISHVGSVNSGHYVAFGKREGGGSNLTTNM